MTDKPSSSPRWAPPPDGVDPAIDLRRLAHAMWRRKLVVVACTVLGGVVGLAASLASTRYVSEGLLLMPGLTLEAYKRYEVALASPPHLEAFLARAARDANGAATTLRRMVDVPGALTEAVRPEFTHTDRDAKAFGVKFEQPGGLVGVRLKLEQREATGEVPVLLLADYVRDTAMRVDLQQRLLTWCLRYETREQELRNENLQGELAVEEQRARVAKLRDIIARTPGAERLEGNQVVSIENGGERYMSPVAQLVAAETTIADLELEAGRRAHEAVEAELKHDYYCKANSVLDRGLDPRSFLASLEKLQGEVFAGRDMATNAVERTSNTLALQRTRWRNNYLERARFVASPEGALVRRRNPGRATGIVGGAVLGFLSGIALALLALWWRVNRDMIVAKDD